MEKKGCLRRILFLAGLVFLVIVLIAIYAIISDKPISGLYLSVQSPSEVVLGDQFDVLITISSNGNNIKMDNLSFENCYLSGFSLVSTDPPSKPLKGHPITLLPFKLTFNSGDKKTFKIVFKAEKNGTYAGTVQAWNGLNNCKYSVQTTVHEKK